MNRPWTSLPWAAALAVCLACPAADSAKPKTSAPKVTDVVAQDYQMPALPKARVVLTDAFGGSHALEVELAATRDARTRGLMWRESVPPGTGMLFIFPEEQELSFWMKNTLVPLDMIFISKDRKVVSVVENAAPRTLDPRSSGRPAQLVLEVQGGWAAKVGLRAGLPVRLEGLAGMTVTD